MRTTKIITILIMYIKKLVSGEKLVQFCTRYRIYCIPSKNKKENVEYKH